MNLGDTIQLTPAPLSDRGVIEGSRQPVSWAGVHSVQGDMRCVPGRMDSTCKGPKDAEVLSGMSRNRSAQRGGS